MKPLLLYNHSGFENRGCEAIVESTCALFSPHAEEIIVASDTAGYDREHSTRKFIDSRITPFSLERVINSIGFRLGQSRKSEVCRLYSPVIRQGQGALCLSVGGDTYCYSYQEHMHYINMRLREKQAKLVLWGCSIDPERIQDRVLEDLRAYDLIVPRESISAKALEEKGFPVVRWIDPAFTLPMQQVQLPESWKDGAMVGVNVSPLVLSRVEDQEKVKENIFHLIDTVLHDTDYGVALIPHVTWAHDNDMTLLGEIAAHYPGNPRVILIPGTCSAAQYKWIVSRLCALVTARTHLSIAGYSNAIPTLVLGYSIKACGIARDIYGNENGHLFPAVQLEDERELNACFISFMGRLAEERMFLTEKMKSYIGGGENMVRRVLSLTGGVYADNGTK